MQTTTTMRPDLPTLLLASLHPNTRKQAESTLNELSQQPAFITALLRLVLDATTPGGVPVRLAGGVFLKNLVKLRWEEVCTFSSCVALVLMGMGRM
jgi:exportin-2 (importin alpha re-exporter)